MKTSTLALRNLLATRQFVTAPLLTLALAGGPTLRYCGGDIDLTVSGDVYVCGGQTGPYFFRQSNYPSCSWEIGTKVSTLQFDVSPGSAQVEGLPFLTAIRIGAFDGAEFTYQRAYMDMAAPAVVVGSVLMFGGRVADVAMGRSAASFTIASHLEILNKPFPRNLYQAGCVNSLYDASCTLNPASFSTGGTVTTGSTPRQIVTSTALGAAGLFDLGRIKMTSGANNGLSRPVRSWDGTSHIALSFPLPAAPANGDTFTITRGCDKTTTACNRFGNIANFRGFPTVPVAETAI